VKQEQLDMRPYKGGCHEDPYRLAPWVYPRAASLRAMVTVRALIATPELSHHVDIAQVHHRFFDA